MKNSFAMKNSHLHIGYVKTKVSEHGNRSIEITDSEEYEKK